MPLFKVEDMSCAHCVGTIERSVKALDACALVKADLATKMVEVTSSVDPATLQAALADAGYEARALKA